jgi:predicted SAM-dependent methyltransferase
MEQKYLTIGGGGFHREGWINLDYKFPKYANKRNFDFIDVEHNLLSMTPLPFENDRIAIVYTEHTIEHLPDHVVSYTFGEVNRILRTDGIFRISCPDAVLLLDMVKNNEMCQISSHYTNADPWECLIYELASQEGGKYTGEQVRKIFSEMSMEDAMTQICKPLQKISIEKQSTDPGGHVTWYTFEKIKKMLEEKGFRDIKRMGQRESRNDELTKRYIDRSAPYYSLYIECIK